MIKWAIKQREASDQFQTTKLHQQWPPATQYIEEACGVLIQPVVVHRVCQLLWFRGPITRTVHWAGRPDAKEHSTELGPRRSFDTWVQEHRDESAAWEESQLESAREVFKEFLDIIAAQLLLKDENAYLRKFAATAVHDIKAPLRGINMALEWMGEDNFEESAVKENHAIAQVSTKKLANLTDGLLELAVIQEQTHAFSAVDLAQVAEDVRALLTIQFQETDAEIKAIDLPIVTANPRLMLRLLLNLIANALKYRHPDRAPRIQISSRVLSESEVEVEVEVSVIDNGLGVAPEYAERIFRPMERLHSKDEIEGSGLGLTICERIMDIHGGTIQIKPADPEGSRFYFNLPLEQKTG